MKTLTCILGFSMLAPTFLFAAPDISSLGAIGPEYRIKPYLDQAIALQKLGSEKAIDLLKAWSQESEYEDQVILLSRMLFVAKGGQDFRRPRIGGAGFMGKTDYVDWPLEPITIHQGVPILITSGYMLAGVAEPSRFYLDYCIKECVWSNFRFNALTEKEISGRIEDFIQSFPWKTPLSQWELNFLRNQTK